MEIKELEEHYNRIKEEVVWLGKQVKAYKERDRIRDFIQHIDNNEEEGNDNKKTMPRK